MRLSFPFDLTLADALCQSSEMAICLARFFVNYTECDADEAVVVAVDFMKKKNVDVVIAPPCPIPAKMMAHLATFYKKTVLGWVVPDSSPLLNCVLQLFATFNWDRVAIFYTTNEIRYCEGIAEDATVILSSLSSYYVNVVLKTEWIRGNDEHLALMMLRAKRSARIILLCLETVQDKRDFMRKASELNMVSDEFVYVLLGIWGFGLGQIGAQEKNDQAKGIAFSNGLPPLWVDIDNNSTVDNVVKEATKRMLAKVLYNYS
ncbi:Guanylate cyclase [Parelaphostrongylus tenuis]|uniref:Guanylate cyclase n=1 Tax=Parelaphostrongylus tenuis TaxID=148309 RepID=A0AAD5QND1_PARTN|nr:Guanylate cyclase [Parelaphostrongylus tenuis]